MATPFIHLHVHSSYSLLQGALTIPRLAELAKADRQPALAITDTGNMFGALEFSEKLAGAGIQPIVGCELRFDFADRTAAPGRGPMSQPVLPRLVLIAASEQGYATLTRIASRAYLDAPVTDAPRALPDWLNDNAGLIALTGGPGGALDQALAEGQGDLARARLQTLQGLFGDRLYIELQRHGTEAEKLTEPALIDLAYRNGVPLVATNEPHFATRSDYEAHDALLALAEGRVLSDTDRHQLTPEHRFKTQDEMRKLFRDLPEAIASTAEIAMRVAMRPRTRKPILPRFAGGSGADAEQAEADELARQAREGLAARLAAHGPAPGQTEDSYRERLEFEIGVIARMKYPGYFLIVADFIKWAKEHGIPVGPGRGSGAGSLVAYALTITDLDPMRFALLFERFLNPERVSMPDFDIDFCQDRRDEVIRYVQDKYGREQVAQIITFGTLQARGVLRDVGRVLQMPFGQVDKLCKLVPQNPANPVTLKQAIEGEPRLQAAADEDQMVRRAFDIALKLEGLNRHASTHAAGIVIGDRPLSELVPMYRDPKSDMPVTQFNMKWVEPAGLVKFDFLGLKTLSVLQKAVQLLAARGVHVDLGAVPLDDPEPYRMLARAETVGIFQLESQGMRRALIDMKPDRFEDIIALVALYRPGPMANIPTYCARKRGDEEPDYIHPQLEPVLKETYGIIVYQEQVMQAAQVLSGYSLGEADLLRRAMGKKIKKEMDAQRERFVSGCVERGIAKAQADTIFDLLAKFADYGFNKSHAAAYALVAYHTAWMKAKYPVEFLAASMSYDMGNTDKLAEFRAEAHRLGLVVEPPSVNRSGAGFDVKEGRIIYALAALKGVGAQAVEAIVEARGEKPFRTLADFANRLNPKAVNKRVVETLASAGAFDMLEPQRSRVRAGAEAILSVANRAREAQASGQNDMFGGASGALPLPLPDAEPWLPAERLQHEYDAVGFFLSGHPLDDYGPVLKRLRVQSWADFSRSVRAGATAGRIAGTVISRQERRTKTGNKMGIIGLSDPSGTYEAVCFSETLAECRDLLEPGTPVLLIVAGELQAEEVRARIQSVEALDRKAAEVQSGLRVFVRDAAPAPSIAKRLDGAQRKAGEPGGEVMIVVMVNEDTEVEVKLKGRYNVTPQMTGALKAVPGVVDVQAA
jgi:DNA polymerase-3 subunit alpha